MLTNAADILSLPSEKAYGNMVFIRGVITAPEPDAEWSGRFFVQDATAGIFVENIITNPANAILPRPGDLVEVAGLSHPGGFAPIITSPKWRKLGTAPLPPAKPALIEQIMAGSEDSQRVEVSGTIRSFSTRETVTTFEIASGGYRLVVNVPTSRDWIPENLIGAKVRARGTAATFFDGKLRHLITVTLNVPSADDFLIEKPEQNDPYSRPITPLDSLAQYRHGQDVNQRVHVKGIVIYQRPGDSLFLQDATGGIHIKSSQKNGLSVGDVVEAIGFPHYDQYLPVLEDATFRKVKEPRQDPTIKDVTIPQLDGGFRHANLIRIQGLVIDKMLRQAISPRGHQPGEQTILTLQNSNFLFTVECPITAVGAEQPNVPVGGQVEASGVCLLKIAGDGKLQSLQIMLPTATSLRVLEIPSWWTPQRLLIGLAGLFTVLLVALSWNVVISRKNAELKISVGEKEQAQLELQHANDRLEERVKERTEQLKVQITARKDAEVQFNAVLHERTRLAQELHDTLEQTLTGIALQMDTAAKFSATDTTRAGHHLNLARNLVTQSQSEVRCSVWDLRSRSPEKVDFSGLLQQIVQRLTEDTSIKVKVIASGNIRPLAELIEENLLRIAQEALTNSIKHARASEAVLAVEYGQSNITLTITDNGIGFALHHQAGPREGHFGLLGIHERARRLQGTVVIHSELTKGTRIQTVIPYETIPEDGLTGSRDGSQL